MKICGPLFVGLGAVFAQAAYLKRSKIILEVTSRTIKKPQGFQRLETGSSPPFKKPTSDTGGWEELADGGKDIGAGSVVGIKGIVVARRLGWWIEPAQ